MHNFSTISPQTTFSITISMALEKNTQNTETATLEFIDRIFSDLDNNKIPIAIFLDLSKAFDTIDHQILLTKLEHYGIANNELNWFTSYISNRKQYVEINGTKSPLSNIITGVSQGSVIGPLLFLI